MTQDFIAAHCQTCDHRFQLNPYWSLRKSVGLHQQASGHTIYHYTAQGTWRKVRPLKAK